VVIPGEVPFDSASLLACGVITGYGAVTNTAQVEPGASVVVIGAGGVGLNSIQAAAAVATTTVIALDTAPEKLDVAMQFGATHALQAGDPDVARKVLALTEGRGPDYVFVTVGSARAVEQGLDLVRKAGMLVVVGLGADDTVARIALRDFASGGRRIIGSKMGGSDLQRDVRALVASYLRGDLLLDELITDRYALEDINAAIAGVGLGSTLRNVVVFE
jgi:S-(hydroxymethyl)mycothiol dehydrogenase